MTAMKRRTLLTISMLLELDEEFYFEMLNGVEDGIRNAIDSYFERNHLTKPEQKNPYLDMVEYYGVSLQPKRKLPVS